VEGSGGVVAGSGSPPRPTHRSSKALAALVVFLLVGSPLAGAIAASVSDGWAVPMWLGGWLLAILIPLVMAVFSA
jgi:hypothetical protein